MRSHSATLRPYELLIMEWRATKLYSILTRTCPFCHAGDFFLAHPYVLSKAGDLHDRCDRCGRGFNKEPGFYYGAMYVSYALGAMVSVAVWSALYLLWPEASTGVQIAAIASALVAGAPWLYATSKIIWANLFFSYQGPPAGEVEGDLKAKS